MKKFFSLVALAAAFVACTPETFETSFDDLNAYAVIAVETYEVSTGEFITTCPITASAGTVNGYNVVLEGNPELAAQSVTITATYDGKAYSETVPVSKLYAGGVAAYSCCIEVGVPVSEYTFSMKLVDSDSVDEVKYADLCDHAGHADMNWAYNNTEMLQPVTIKYTLYYGSEYVESSCNTSDAGLVKVFESYVDAAKKSKINEIESASMFTVSAWAMYSAFETRTIEEDVFQVVATKGSEEIVLGAITMNKYSSKFEHTEMASDDSHASHAGHYEQGHGHGTAENAGGGIVFAD